MTTITVCKFKVMDASTGYDRVGVHMATKAYIDLVDGWPIDGTEIEVDLSRVDEMGRLVR